MARVLDLVSAAVGASSAMVRIQFRRPLDGASDENQNPRLVMRGRGLRVKSVIEGWGHGARVIAAPLIPMVLYGVAFTHQRPA